MKTKLPRLYLRQQLFGIYKGRRWDWANQLASRDVLRHLLWPPLCSLHLRPLCCCSVNEAWWDWQTTIFTGIAAKQREPSQLIRPNVFHFVRPAVDLSLSLCVTYLLLAGRSPKEILLPFLYLNWYTGLALFLVENPFSGRPYHRIIISKDCGIVCFIDPFLFVPSYLFKRYTYLKSWWDKLTLTVGACLQKWRRSECVSQQQCLV